MSDPTPKPPTPAEFLQAQAATRFAAQVADAERKLVQAQKEVADLRGAAGTFCWHIDGSTPVYFNFADGAASVAETPAGEPFMTMRMSAADWERFATGKVAGGMLDGGDRGGFGKSRLDKLKPMRGTLRFQLTGLPDGDWSADVGINSAPVDPPTAQISMPADVAADIQAGKLNPQMAFMQGKVKMTGDVGLVMQFGMAMAM